MFCDKCGQPIDTSDKFCPKCGSLNSEFRETMQPEQRENQKPKKKVSVGYIAGTIALSVCIIVGIVFLVTQALQLKNSMDKSKSSKNKTEIVKGSDKEDSGKENSTKAQDNQTSKADEEDKVEINPKNSGTDSAVKNTEEQKNIANGTEHGTQEVTLPNQDYILPESNSRYYSETEIGSLSEHDLFIARNEIYARHGRMFDNEELKNYFATKSWYVPQYAAKEFDAFGDSRFNEYEIFNRNEIVKREKQLKGN